MLTFGYNAYSIDAHVRIILWQMLSARYKTQTMLKLLGLKHLHAVFLLCVCVYGNKQFHIAHLNRLNST